MENFTNTFATSYLKDEPESFKIFSLYENYNLKVSISINCTHHLHANETLVSYYLQISTICEKNFSYKDYKNSFKSFK